MSFKGSSKKSLLFNHVHTHTVHHIRHYGDVATNTLKLYTPGEGSKWNPSSAASTCVTRFSSRYNDALIVPPGSSGWDNLDSPAGMFHDLAYSPDDSHIVLGVVARTTTQNLSSVCEDNVMM